VLSLTVLTWVAAALCLVDCSAIAAGLITGQDEHERLYGPGCGRLRVHRPVWHRVPGLPRDGWLTSQEEAVIGDMERRLAGRAIRLLSTAPMPDHDRAGQPHRSVQGDQHRDEETGDAAMDADTMTGPGPLPRLLAVEVLLAEPEALQDDVLESCLYILRDRLRGTDGES
jgi:hypothetical protein